MVFGSFWILHDGYSSSAFYGVKPRDAVLKLAGQENPDHSRCMAEGGASKKRIDGRPMPIFTRPRTELNMTIFDAHMNILRADIHVSILDLLGVGPVLYR